MEKIEFMVQVICLTFNQKEYIKETLDGFCSQETSFNFVCSIIDDASTDGEKTVIEDYLNENFDKNNKELSIKEETTDYTLLFYRHKTNKHCYFAVYYLKYNHFVINKDKYEYLNRLFEKTKYVALCEGDDYWIDSRKLEKQVNYLENHHDVAGVHTAYKEYYQNLGKSNNRYWKSYSDQKKFASDIITCNTDILTCTIMYRQDKYSEMFKKDPGFFVIDGESIVFDIQIFSLYAYHYGIGYIKDVTSVYRIHDNSISARGDADKKISHRQRAYKIRNHMANYLNLPSSYKDKIRVVCNLEILEAQLEAGKYCDAQEVVHDYLNIIIVRFLVAAFRTARIKNPRVINKVFQVFKVRERLLADSNCNI